MKVCVECGRQLFDYDTCCDKCHSNNIITEMEYNNIVNEIKTSNIVKKKILLRDHNYQSIYSILQHPQPNYPAPSVLLNNQNDTIHEDSSEYWDRINRHTINNPQPTTPTITCPYCQSTDMKKISGASRWLSVGMFGMGSKKIGKQWHCNKCGSDF